MTKYPYQKFMDCKRGPDDGFYADKKLIIPGLTQEEVAKAAAGFIEAIQSIGVQVRKVMAVPGITEVYEELDAKKKAPKTGPAVKPFAKLGKNYRR